MVLHANAVAENRAPGVGTGRIDSDDPNCAVFFAIVLSQLIDQRALACTGRAGQPNGERLARVREKFFEQIDPSRRMVLDSRDRSGEGARVSQAKEGN